MGWEVRRALQLSCSSSSFCRSPILLVDQEDRILAVLVGRPADVPGRPRWEDTHDEALVAMHTLEDDIRWGRNEALPTLPGSKGKNRRGKYRAVNVGPSYGGGQNVSFIACLNVTRLYLTT